MSPRVVYHVWRVTGDAATDSSGGQETWLYFTDRETTLPDLTPSIEGVHGRDRHWSRIDRVEYLGLVPPRFLPELFGTCGVPGAALWAEETRAQAIVATITQLTRLGPTAVRCPACETTSALPTLLGVATTTDDLWREMAGFACQSCAHTWSAPGAVPLYKLAR